MSAIAVVGFTWKSITQVNSEQALTREGQITDRYTAAVENLGSKAEDVRLGGVYALQRLMNDSPRDQATVIDVLSAFIRSHSKKSKPGEGETRFLTSDVTAAASVLKSRNSRNDGTTHVNLHKVDLRQADLRYGKLGGANLNSADLRAVDLSHADLHDARLNAADLRNARLGGAGLSDAWLNGADLRDAHLNGADLRNARLFKADLRGAYLHGANLRCAMLFEADLRDLKEPLSPPVKSCHLSSTKARNFPNRWQMTPR
ncbi:pentapeptide repeat-containing protein [Streptomyces sp. NPDC057686]|uniref:pentapeptide repeat-containing protein n=1 Tax=Streptomyces sp. NPDC057686 TaxID=3346212 RepID=UPI0036B4B512